MFDDENFCFFMGGLLFGFIISACICAGWYTADWKVTNVKEFMIKNSAYQCHETYKLKGE